ncbi:MAG TPA: hypothetical protein EYP56_21285, partial [Planctomycetaceae bacterium]|nr:hypothetical protein [Planctomycetaceae bacterium]
MRCFAAVLIVLTAGILVLASHGMAQQPPPAPGDETQLIAVLESDAPLFDKAKACQRLATIGTARAVPALARLLTDKQLSHYARYGLEPIPDRSADAALREALGKLEGGLLVGVINSIGMRRDRQAVEPLGELLGSRDADVAAAAAAALGRIASLEALQKLRGALGARPELRSSVADACLTAADMLVAEGGRADALALYDQLRRADVPKRHRVAALLSTIRLRGAEGLDLLVEQLAKADKDLFEAALSAAHQLPAAEVTRALLQRLDNLPPGRQALVIHVLGDLGDPAALPGVLGAARSGPHSVRLAAIQVLGKLPAVSALPVLLDTAVGEQEELAEAARRSLVQMESGEVDRVLAESLAKSRGKRLLLLVELAGQRGITAAAPTLVKLADHQDPAVAATAVAALGRTAGP